ncbi:putative acetolactate synthase protein [Neofusicoccum parvum UCRNP2]|uniref:Putative acetolactate synthase protein n=1 Tax=Botryosphaeria parva (strain UCR-NP2) TaxID=1287680 RepID=R1G1Y1_BOTPV|nr:putative acetolactate synthase protein [Neofusicoccum parvum UCRNP2]
MAASANSDDDFRSRTQQSPLASQRAKQQGSVPPSAPNGRGFSGWFPLGYKEGFTQWQPPTHTQTGSAPPSTSPSSMDISGSPADDAHPVTTNSVTDPYGPRRWYSTLVQLSGKERALNEFSVERVGEQVENNLVMLHGYGAGLGFFYKNFEGLSRVQGWKLYALDLLGMGRSSRPPFRIHANDRQGKITEAENWFIDALEEWRIKKGIDRFTLLGHSLGGYMAVAYALKYPGHLNKLILASPVGIPEDPYAVNSEMPEPSDSTMASEFTQDQENTIGGSSASAVGKGDNNNFLNARSKAGPQENGKPARKPLPKWLTYLWDANISPFSFFLGPHAGPIPDGDGDGATAKAGDGQKRENGIPVVFMYGENDWMDVAGGFAAEQKMKEEKEKTLAGRSEEEKKNDNGSAKVLVIKKAGHHVYLDGWEQFNEVMPSFAFFEAIWEAGITHCFVNLGSDHPSIIEAIVKGQNEKKGNFPKIVTCPNEMVALSMADGYARLTNKPQCVIVHVDVGTQGLGAAVHNASCGRAPVLIFAGLSPYTIEGEMRGSRTEYIHWIQDVPDQKQIVAQYCRYTGEIKTGKNVKQMVNRALSFAMSDPKGPVYLYGAREAMEQDLEPYTLDQAFWNPVEPPALSSKAVKTIAEALVHAVEPLVVTGYSGRNHAAVGELVKLADTVRGLRVLDTGGSDMCFPANHPAWLGLRYGVDESIKTADVILVLDCDIPWINTQCHPKEGAKIYHIDADPLKQQMPVFYIKALARYKADSEISLNQLHSYITSTPELSQQVKSAGFDERWNKLQDAYKQKLTTIASLAKPGDDGSYGASYLVSRVRSWINCGGGGLGWSGGGALGIKLATDNAGQRKFVCQIVGDGTYLFSVPGSVYWISQRYKIPILTIVLNNKGWNAPRKSLLLVHPSGEGSKVSNEELNISFAPTPDYSGIAKAASGGEIWAAHASTAEELGRLLPEAVKSVMSGTSAVLDAHLDGPQGKYPGNKATLAGLVSEQFGDEFATVYYKWKTVALLMDLGDMTYIDCTTGTLSGATLPFRKDYCLIRQLDVSIYLDNSHPMICQWCYWQEAKTSEARPLFQDLHLGTEEDSDARTCSQASLPALKSLHLRFISEGRKDHYLAREWQVARVIKAFARAIPAQAAMTMCFMTNQRRRNATAERLFTQGRGTRQIVEAVGRPLWFQCDPAMKYGGRVQRWLDEGLTYLDIVPRVAQIQWELLREKEFAEKEPREQRERMFRRRRGREFEIVVLEMLKQ